VHHKIISTAREGWKNSPGNGRKTVLLTRRETGKWRHYGQACEGYSGFHLSPQSIKGTRSLPVKAFRPRILRPHDQCVAKPGIEPGSLKVMATVLDKMPHLSFSSMTESRIWHNQQQKQAPLHQLPHQNANAFPDSQGFYSYFSPVRALFPVLKSPLSFLIEAT